MKQVIERTHHFELAQSDDGRLAIRPHEDTGRSRGWRERFRAARRFMQDLETFACGCGSKPPASSARPPRLAGTPQRQSGPGDQDGPTLVVRRLGVRHRPCDVLPRGDSLQPRRPGDLREVQ